MGLFNQLSQTKGTQNILTHRLESRQLLEMEVSRLKGTFAAFPLIKKAGSSVVASYVRCYSRTFMPAKNKDGITEFYAMELTADEVKLPVTDGFCPAPFEVHIQPLESQINSADVYVMMPMAKIPGGYLYRTTIELQPGI